MITSFSGEYRFLSNFYPAYIVLDLGFGEKKYDTVEHAYQAAKALSEPAHEWVRLAPKASHAKQRGRDLDLRSDSESRKFVVMRLALADKFSFGTNPELAQQLLDTAPHYLIEGNTWGDRIWGATDIGPAKKLGIGENWLGYMLMAQRSILAAS